MARPDSPTRWDRRHYLYGMFHELAERSPELDWLGFVDRKTGRVATQTLERLDERVRRLAQGMRSVFGGPGDRVVLMLENQSEFVEAWLAAHLAEFISVPLSTELKGPILEHELRTTAPVGAVVVASALRTLEAALKANGLDITLAVVGSEDSVSEILPSSRSISFADLFTSGEAEAQFVREANETCCVMFTSGTTGPSKGVEISNHFSFRMAHQIAHYMGYSETDVLYTTLPLCHGNALHTSLMPSLAVGARLRVGQRFSVSRFWRDIVASRATSTNLLGAMVPMLLKQPPSDLEKKNVLERGFVIPANAHIKDQIRWRFGFRAITAYGLTDAGMVLWEPLEGDCPPDSCGRPVIDFECVVVDDADRPVPAGVVGELVVRPTMPWVTSNGYWGMPQETVKAWRNLWLHTGDLMSVDEEGWFYFKDRAKDAIRRRGQNISAYEVESVLDRFDFINECAAYPLPSELGEDELAVALVLSDPSKPFDAAELLEEVGKILPKYAVPRYVRVVESLPRTINEKIQKFQLRDEGVTPDMYDAGDQRALTPDPATAGRQQADLDSEGVLDAH